ncbi:MAG: phosphatidate cytidylyltransferase [Actinomycetota bacterium]
MGPESEPETRPLEPDDAPGTARLDPDAPTPSTLDEPEVRPGRPLKIAIAAGLTLAALAIGTLILGSGPFFVLAAMMVLIAQGEFYLAARKGGHAPATALGLMAGAVLLFGAYFRGETAVALVLFLTALFAFVWYLAGDLTRPVFSSVAITMLGVAYPPLLGVFAALILRRPDDGRGIMLAMIGAAAIYDVLAYAGGSRFGRRALAPTISPRKTAEGAAVASIGVLMLGTLLAPLLGPWSFPQAFVFSALICLGAPVGDLVESLIKRDLGIKDMGGLIPGHGGSLDRLDGILFCAPAAYFSLVIFGI